MLYSNVLLVGTVKSIDEISRDVIAQTKTPKLGKDVDVKIHFWKRSEDPDSPHYSRPDWTEKVHEGAQIKVFGHMGNNGRVIATAFAPIGEEEDED